MNATNTTTKATHTPGPWHIGLCATDRAIYGPKGEHVATLPDMLMPDEVLGNARLIAAAPELLEFVARVARTQEGGPYTTATIYAIKQDARALIARATL